jgi:uncharacterized protein YjbJ (UPF0337 family)
MGAIIDKIKGKAKQIEGRLTGDDQLVAQGRVQEAKGDIEGVASRVARQVKRTVSRIKTGAKAGLARAGRGIRVG